MRRIQNPDGTAPAARIAKAISGGSAVSEQEVELHIKAQKQVKPSKAVIAQTTKNTQNQQRVETFYENTKQAEIIHQHKERKVKLLLQAFSGSAAFDGKRLVDIDTFVDFLYDRVEDAEEDVEQAISREEVEEDTTT